MFHLLYVCMAHRYPHSDLYMWGLLKLCRYLFKIPPSGIDGAARTSVLRNLHTPLMPLACPVSATPTSNFGEAATSLYTLSPMGKKRLDGVRLAVDHAERALDRAEKAEIGTDPRVGALIEAVWWVGAAWEASGRPKAGVLSGFYWLRNRSLHDVAVLVRRYGGYQHGYAGSPSPVTKTADPYSDTYSDRYQEGEVWGILSEIEPALTEPDRSKGLRTHYVSHLEGREVMRTIETAIGELRDP